MGWFRYGRRGGLALSGLLPALACSPKVHLEFDDASSSFGWEDATDTSSPTNDDGDESRRDDDDDDDGADDNIGPIDVGWTSTESTGQDTLLSTVTTSTSDTSDTAESTDTDFGLECYDYWDCPPGFECINHACIDADGCGYYDLYCCPSGVFDQSGLCCRYDVDAYGTCIEEPCGLDLDCIGAQVCGASGTCETVQPTPECGSASSLVRTALPVAIPATERIAIGDLDGNGTRDGFIAHQNTGAVLWTISGLTESTEPSMSSTADIDFYAGDLALADFDEDGIDDLVISYPNVGSTHVRSSRYVTSTNVIQTAMWDVKVGDFDGDGHFDIVSTNGAVQALFGAGDGSFEHHAFEIWAQAVGVGDFDADGILDVVAADPGTLTVFGFAPDRSLVWKADLAHRSTPEDVFITDLEGDGTSDVGLVGSTSFGSVLYTWRSEAMEDEPSAAYFYELFLHFAVPAPPSDRYLVLAGASGQVHVRDLLPACWNTIDMSPVWDIATGFDPSGTGERVLLTTGSSGPRVTALATE